MAAEGKSFGVYVHWPFCLSKCPYCDFNSHVRHGGIDQERFVDLLAPLADAFPCRTTVAAAPDDTSAG